MLDSTTRTVCEGSRPRSVTDAPAPRRLRPCARGITLWLAIAVGGGGLAGATETERCSDVLRPSQCQLQDYERQRLFPWLVKRQYRTVAHVDKRIRDTGPFIQLTSYGTHPAVRIYYSPEVYSWLEDDRQGPLPDGAFIVKEMFRSPAAIYAELKAHPFLAENPNLYEALLDQLLGSWVVMIKDSGGDSVDGWFWGALGAPPRDDCVDEPAAQGETCREWLYGTTDPYHPGALDDYRHVFYSGFGLGTCIRCHASAASESTFSAGRNISGFPSEEAPLEFRVDNSWRSPRYLGSYPGTDAASDGGEKKEELPCRFEQIERPANPGDVVALFGIVERFLRDHGDPDRCALLNKLSISPHLRPYDDGSEPTRESYGPHDPQRQHVLQLATEPEARTAPSENEDFRKAFHYPGPSDQGKDAFTLPMQWADHAYPRRGESGTVSKNHDQYITSNNCIGCHGGLAGSPYPLSMFVQTGPTTKAGPQGYDISPYNEWRWSPMGLAGRDPIFHAQLESELILLLRDGGQLGKKKPSEKAAGSQAPCQPLCGTVADNQKALINTCLSCHGAMGQRQLGLDAGACEKGPECNLDGDFNPDYYYLTEALTEKELSGWAGKHGLQPPFPRSTPHPAYEYTDARDFYSYHRYGELAREGISCAVCHHIAAPGSTAAGRAALDEFVSKKEHEDWLPERRGQPIWSDNFIYYLAYNTTGQYETGPADEIYGPFADVLEKPMQASLGITPRAAPPMADKLNNVFAWRRATGEAKAPTYFTADSNMCGTCHTINLPNIGLEPSPPGCDPAQDLDCNPLLRKVERNKAFEHYAHSIEQATFLEWANSDFGPGMFNTRGRGFKSCQECHMPNRLTTYDRDVLDDPRSHLDPQEPSDPKVHVQPLVSQIATIQDTGYPESDNSLSPEQMTVPLRDTYRRHELVGLNTFVIEMASQFPDVLGVDPTAYETGATNGAELAIDSILLSAREGRVVTLDLGAPKVEDGHLHTDVTVTNKTGHRFPSGVAFRRAWIEFAVYDDDPNLKDGTRTEIKPIWASGQTNAAGLITDTEGRVLATELLDQRGGRHGLSRYQPHHQTIIDDNQVQIYEELITNAEFEFTTSFIHRVHHVKDNRLLPKGWVDAVTFAGYNQKLAEHDPRKIQPQGEILLQFFKAADPLLHFVRPERGREGYEDPAKDESGQVDPDYKTGTDAEGFLTPVAGSDSLKYQIPCRELGGCDRPLWVSATVHFQATPPSWLDQRFRLAEEAKKHRLATPATDRLYYLMSRLELGGGPMEHYKLPLVSKTAAFQGRP